MPPRRIAIYILVFLVVPFALGWFLLAHLDDLPESWRSKLPLGKKSPAAATAPMPFMQDTQALMALVEENPSSPKARRLLEQARKDPRTYLEALTQILRSEESWVQRRSAIRLLPALPSPQSVALLRDEYPRFLKEPDLRKEAVKSLTLLQGFGAVDALLAAVQIEPDGAIRKQILNSLALIAEEKDVPKLETVLKRLDGLSAEEAARITNAPGERRATTETLMEIHKADPAEAKARERLKLLLLESPTSAIRSASIQRLARSGVSEAVGIVADWVASAPEGEKEKHLVDMALVSLAQEKGERGKAAEEALRLAFEPRLSQPAAKQRWERYQRLRQASETPKK